MSAARRRAAWIVWLSLALEVSLGILPATDEQALGAEGDSGVVIVSVRPAVKVSLPQVFVRDVAACAGGSAKIREQIAKLDLADLPLEGQATTILREQIYYRILIGGIDPKQFRVQGASHVQVELARYLVTEEDVLEAAKALVRERLPEAAEDVHIQLAQPVRGLMVVPSTRARVHFEAQYSSAVLPLGKVRVDVTVVVHGEERGSVPVFLDVRMREQVAVCSRRIERGELLSKDNVYFDWRTLDSFKDYLPKAQAQAGRRAKISLATGQVITRAEVEAVVAENPLLVKQQGIVKMVARLGTFEVVTNGEALQDGRMGQLIRLRNLDSRSIVVGRVVDRSVVEIEY